MLFITALSQTMALAQEQGQSKIIVDQSYPQRRVSERKLTFSVYGLLRKISIDLVFGKRNVAHFPIILKNLLCYQLVCRRQNRKMIGVLDFNKVSFGIG